MATLFASEEVVAVPNHEGVSKSALADKIQAIGTAQTTAARHRSLRTSTPADEEDKPEEEEERAWNLVSLKDLMKVDDIVESKRFEVVLGKTMEAWKTRQAMFNAMYANKEYETKVLKAIDAIRDHKSQKSLKSMWSWYRVGRGIQYEAKVEAAAAAARRKVN